MPAPSSISISVSGTDRNVSVDVSTRQIDEQISFGQRGDRELTNYVNKYKQVGSGFGFVSQWFAKS